MLLYLLASKDTVKSILRNTVLHALALFLLSQSLAGVKISGGVTTLLIAGLALSIMNYTIKPILSILTLPFNLATFGAFSFLINALIVYLLTVLVTQISIVAFTFPGFSFAGFIVPHIYLNTFFAYVAVAFFLSILMSIITWFIK